MLSDAWPGLDTFFEPGKELLIVDSADAVLAASIFHFGQFSIAEAKRHLAANGIPIRP